MQINLIKNIIIKCEFNFILKIQKHSQEAAYGTKLLFLILKTLYKKGQVKMGKEETLAKSKPNNDNTTNRSTNNFILSSVSLTYHYTNI